RRLARRVQRGDEKAAERLVTANLRFVISYVKKYQGHGLDLSELVAIGNEGLLKAVKKFDPDQGVKFISYAVWWVRQAVLMTLEKIGALMGVTRERIRQIRERAFEKLRESPDGRALKGFWRAACGPAKARRTDAPGRTVCGGQEGTSWPLLAVHPCASARLCV